MAHCEVNVKHASRIARLVGAAVAFTESLGPAVSGPMPVGPPSCVTLCGTATLFSVVEMHKCTDHDHPMQGQHIPKPYRIQMQLWMQSMAWNAWEIVQAKQKV